MTKFFKKIAILITISLPLSGLAQTNGLIGAIEEGDIEKVSSILSEGVDVNAAEERSDFDTPLIKAVQNNAVEIVKLLLENPAIQVNKQNKWKQSPLIFANMEGNIEIVKLLLEVPSLDTEVRDVFQNNILMVASSYGHAELVRLYLGLPELKLNINEQNYAENTALMLASRYGHSDVAALLLKDPDIDVNLTNDSEETALIVASTNASADIVRQLVNMPDTKLDAVDKDGNTALIYASRYGYAHTLNYLLSAENKDHLNLRDERSFTPLMWAIKNDYLDAAIVLVRYGVDANLQDAEGNTALMLACYKNDFTMVDLLLGIENINVDIRNNLGLTALEVAGRTINPRHGISLYEFMSTRIEFIEHQRQIGISKPKK